MKNDIDTAATFRLPTSALRYALFQRVHYLRQPLFRLLSLVAKVRVLHKTARGLQAILFSRAITEEYVRDTVLEFERMRPFFPKRACAILDIGCGIAGIDVLVSDYYHREPDIFLLDKTQVERHIFYSYFDTAAFYNSLVVSKEVLIINGIPEQQIHLIEATDDATIPVDRMIDLAISLTAWGYHFPVATYLDSVYAKLNPGGRVILDIRDGTDGESAVKKKFGNVTLVYASAEHRYRRIMAEKELLS